MSKPIYAIFNRGEVAVTALIRAPNRARALAHFTARELIVRLADPDDLILATKDGVEVEDATEQQAAETAVRA